MRILHTFGIIHFKINDMKNPILFLLIIIILAVAAFFTGMYIKGTENTEDIDLEEYNNIEKKLDSTIKSLERLRDSLFIFRSEYHKNDSLYDIDILKIRYNQKQILHEKIKQNTEIINSSDSADWVWFNSRFTK